MAAIERIRINRAPVLTLWAAVVAERIGFDWAEALTLGRAVAGLNAYADGLRALAKGRPIPAESVQRYLESKFGQGYAAARSAMTTLAKAHSPANLSEQAYALYEDFRPAVPTGTKGWGAAGVLDLRHVRTLAKLDGSAPTKSASSAFRSR